MNPLTEPENVVAAREHLAKVRAAIARHREIDAATAAAIASAKAQHLAACSDAALEGVPPPKTTKELHALRDSAADSADVLADLERRERAAVGDLGDVIQAWGLENVRRQLAADVEQGRAALRELATAARKLVSALGNLGAELGFEVLRALPEDVKNAQASRAP
jgi:hypothetical protein